MTRITGAGQTESQSAVVAPLLLVYLGITAGNGPYYFTNHDADVAYNGNIYKRSTVGIGTIAERDDYTITMRKVTFSLDESDLLTVFKTRANYVKKPMTITEMVLQEDGTQIVLANWVGFIANRGFHQTEEGQALAINCQDWFAVLGKKGWVRFDSVSQKQRAPDVDGNGNPDTFFDNMPGIKGQHVVWMGQTNGGKGAAAVGGERGGGGLGQNNIDYITGWDK